MKTCIRCRVSKTDDLFKRQTSLCKSCDSTASLARYYKNRDKILSSKKARRTDEPEYRECCRQAAKRSRIKCAYGITPEEYAGMLNAQDNKCKICGGAQAGRWGNLHLDHNHSNAKPRGFLCVRCNSALGLFKDDCAILRRAADYVEREGNI